MINVPNRDDIRRIKAEVQINKSEAESWPKNEVCGNHNNSLLHNLQTSKVMIPQADTLEELYQAVQIAVDLPKANNKLEMRKNLTMVAGAWLSKEECEHIIELKETFLIDLAKKLMLLSAESFI